VTKLVATAVLAAAFSWQPIPARLGVSATEFHLVLSRPSVKAGRVEIELQNDGEDVHDLRLRRIGGTRIYSVPRTKPGRNATVEVTLRPGRYRLWCSIANHRALGMQTVLRVRR
jgi:uncharacterized cupredoxin-like copper-binding protein